MTLEGHVETVHTRPVPAPPSKKPSGLSVSSRHHHHVVDRRFTVRDGFHLKTRNAEAQAIVDQQLLPCGDSSANERTWESADDDELRANTSGPSKRELPSALHLQTAAAKSTESNNKSHQEDQQQSEAAIHLPAAENGEKSVTSTAIVVLDQLLLPEGFNQNTSREETSGGVHAALKAPAEWLIYRHRPSETPLRKQKKVDKLLHEMLQEPPQPNQTTAKEDETLEPTRPRCQSTLGPTYSQRVAAARPSKRPSQQQGLRHTRERLVPLTDTERALLRDREANNKAVDRLLVSLFQTPTFSSFSTRRSVVRHETAVALRSRNLLSRVNELRSLPQLLEQMEALRQWKQRQHIDAHGTDLVARNRANVQQLVLQKPSQTPLLPSATDHKLHQASKRKQELDAAQEENVRRVVNRWQTRRKQHAEQARRIHVQSQWLLLVTLAETSHSWLAQFHEFRQRRHALVRVMMAKRLQRYWRQRSLERHNPSRSRGLTPLLSAFAGTPLVLKAVVKLQRSIRRWFKRKQQFDREHAVTLIVTAWLEFQDVKFRRIILRFRKRVRDFQVMWRGWRAITDARVRLLLLVWNKLERKAKRRHAVAAVRHAVTFSTNSTVESAESTRRPGNTSSVKGLTLIDVFQVEAANRLLHQPDKHIEGMHRHLRNGGTVRAPANALSSGPPASHASFPATSSHASPPSTPGGAHKQRSGAGNAHVRQDLQLKHHMEEEFQLAMYDFFTTRQTTSPSRSKPSSPTRPSFGTTRTPDRQPSKTRAVVPAYGFQHPPLSLQMPLSSLSSLAPPPSEKVPLQLKLTLLRQLISTKRKQFSEARDRGREAWIAARKQMRDAAFRYDVLEELAAYQRLQAKYAVFLMLHNISETEIMDLIHRAQRQANAAAMAASISTPNPSDPIVRSAARESCSGAIRPSGVSKSHGIVPVGTSVIERFDDDE
ncbi:hypothetical protein BBJ28_00007136 [Nothophytophthora sp. Chile5]|nr:hypothetical protein BBJ28_00007136 [Nothophytophthora sp. Chile5]